MRPVRVRGIQSLGQPAARVRGVARVALNLRGASRGDLARGMALVQPGRWTLTDVVDARLSWPAGPAGAGPAARAGPARRAGSASETAPRLPRELTLHIGSARTVARVRVLGGMIARLTLREPQPLHVGDRVLLRDPGAAARADSHPSVLGATILDVTPPPLGGRGGAAAAAVQLGGWPELPRRRAPAPAARPAAGGCGARDGHHRSA